MNNYASLILLFFAFSTWAFADSAAYQVKLTLDSRNPADASVRIIVNLAAQDCIKINKEAPISLRLSTIEGFKLKKNDFVQSDGKFEGQKQIEWRIPATITNPKKQSIAGIIQFYLCTDKWCRKYDAKIKQNFDFNIASNLT